LLWTSEVWNRRDKIIGTVLTPGGALLLLVGTAVTTASGASGVGGHFYLLMFFFMPLATAVYLAVRLNRRRAGP
jgi:membrane protein implicated in regulation of membrane protease activity